MKLKLFIFVIISSLSFNVLAQPYEFFDSIGNIKPKFLDDNNILDEQYLPYTVEYFNIDSALMINKQVYRLNISSKKISNLPDDIYMLSELQILDINDNYLTTLPREIQELSYLRYLSLNTNLLNSLPPEIGQLKFLEMLNCENNKLSTLPYEIGDLIN